MIEYVKKDIREFYDVVVVRGQWDASLANPMSNAYQELLKLSDEITEFDEMMANSDNTVSSGEKKKNNSSKKSKSKKSVKNNDKSSYLGRKR